MNNKAEYSSRPIGFISNSAWYIYIHRWDAIQFLINHGYNILIIAPEDRAVPAFRHPSVTFIPLAFSNKSLNVFSAVKLYFSLKKLYNLYQPACLFHYAIKANTFGNFAANSAGIPCVSVIIGTGYSFIKTGWLFRVAIFLYRRSLRLAEEIWFMNKEDGALFLQHKLVDPSKMLALRGEGINTGYYDPALFTTKQFKTGFSFITATRFLYSKGLATMAKSIKMLKDKGFDFQFLLVGAPDKHHPDSIPEAVITQWAKQDIYTVIPFSDDVRPWLAKADCFILPSFYNEGLPRCLMEAASMQLPIITTFQQGCKDAIIDGETGFFSRTGDADDLALQMQNMLQMDAQKREKLGVAGRKYMQETFSQEIIFPHYLRVVKKMTTG
jgi:glycosyltransferase involved in cell wall biosynthesis